MTFNTVAAREIKSEYARASALSALAPHLNKEEKIITLAEMLYLYNYIITDSVTNILSMWKNIEFEGLEKNLIPFIKFTSQKNRIDGAEVVGALTPALVHFSGERITGELLRAIQDTARWWP